MLEYNNPWLFNGLEFNTELVGNNVGFVYIITNTTTNKRYIGKKLFTSAKRKQVKKKRKTIRVESDWKEYYGSNEYLKKDIESLGANKFKREILHLCPSKGLCNYLEAKEQFDHDVLRDPSYYNYWIQCKVHRKHVSKTNGEI